MKVVGIFLILLGIVMIASGGFNVKAKEKTTDTKRAETSRIENPSVNRLQFAGGLAILAGLALQTSTKKTAAESLT